MPDVKSAGAPDSGRRSHEGSGRYNSIISCEDRLEEALCYLVRTLGRHPNRGKKPVVVHSLRVGLRLMAAGYDGDVVVAGVLHDLLEKTPIGRSELAGRFGATVARLVAAATNDAAIANPLVRYEDSLARCVRLGPEAVAIRAADLLDNCERLMARGDERRLVRLSAKLRLLIRAVRRCSLDSTVLTELQACYRRIHRRAPTLALAATKHHASGARSRCSSRHG